MIRLRFGTPLVSSALICCKENEYHYEDPEPAQARAALMSLVMFWPRCDAACCNHTILRRGRPSGITAIFSAALH